ncbi:murein biosynthesis integral membrane protein MurJ [Pseudoalteromonas sp. SSM20]|uniref:murein biosynthesis integral membrane protein MurJ n=2 Tax=unclassified Pseudoalteromonas TaxID=194690 RepID=UPI003BAB5266
MAKGLFRSGMVVSFMTFLSRILGLVRDAVTAHLLGAGAAADIFLFANKIPNFLRRLFAEGAFAQAFVPVLTEVKEKDGDNGVRLFVAQAAGTLGTVLLIVTILGVIGSGVVAAIFAPGWYNEYLAGGNEGFKYELFSQMLKLTFPYLFFVSLVALSGAVLNVYNQFSVAAFTPVLLNISIIFCAYYFHDKFEFGAFAMALGVFIGGVVQLLFQLPFLRNNKVLVKPKFAWRDKNVKKVRTLMLPAMFGVSVSQINLLLDTVIASFLVTGSVAWLYYSDRLIEFPLGLFGIGIATVILPTLSKLHVNDDPRQFQATVDWGVRFVMWLGIPACFGLIALAPIIINVLFGHGEFMASGNHVDKVAMGVTAYATGLLSFMLIKVLAPAFYAKQNTKTPAKIGVAAMVLNMVFNLMLAPIFGYLGLALATSLSATCNAILLYYFLQKQQVYRVSKDTSWFFIKCLISSVLMFVAVYQLQEYFVWQQQGFTQQVILLSGFIVSAVVVYFVLLLLMGVRFGQIKNIN